MKHLKLKQNSNTEIVTSAIIEKLYQLVSNNTLDSSSSLSGNLQSPHAFEDSVDYLTKNYPNLSINITDGKYIRFKDSAVAALCLSNWGDTVGVTTTKAASIGSIGTIFKDNTNIVSFDELEKFSILTQLDTQAFSYCTLLSSIKLPSSLTTIYNNAFENNTSLVSIDLSNVTILGSGIFHDCTKLESVGNTGKISHLDSYVFVNCSNLKSINLASCNSVEQDALHNCTLLSELGDTSKIYNVGQQSFDSCAAIKTINMPALISTSWGSFAYCTSLTTIGSLPKLLVVSNGCFSGCTNLKSIGITNFTTEIQDSAFINDTSLTDVGDVSGVLKIVESAFQNCTSLPSVNLDKITSIDNNAFNTCTALTSVGNTSNLTNIGKGAFNNCINLQSIDVSNVTSFEYSCFYNCALLSSFTFNDNVSFVNNDAFTGTAWYSNQPDGLIKIGKVWYKYKGTAPSTDVVMDDDITYMTRSCYAGQPITGFTFNSKVTDCSNFNGCYNLKQVTLNNKITTINYQSFYGCRSLTTINMENITKLNSSAFDTCTALPYLHLYNITNINEQAFSNCTGLKYVRIDAATVPILNNISAFNNTTCNIYVPDTLVDSYKTATNWSSLASRIFSMTQFATDFPNG